MTEAGMENLQLLRVPEVAAMLHVSRATVWRLIYSGELESVIVGVRSRRVAPEAIAEYKERLRSQAARRNRPTAEPAA